MNHQPIQKPMKNSKLSTVLLVILLSITAFPSQTMAQNVLDFDGTDDRLQVANASSYIANSNLSMAFWVYPTNPSPNFPNFDGIAGFRNDANADFYLLHLSTTNVEARFRNSNGTSHNIVYSGIILNAWNHFAMTYDGTSLVLYHNGVVASSTAASGAITNTTAAFNIGFLPFSNTDFLLDGQMDDVCLYNKALTANEVSALYNDCSVDLSDTNLQLCYEFNQGIPGGNNTGISTATDSKGNINGFLSGFALVGASSNFVAGGKATASTISPVANCNYTSPSGQYTWTSTGVYMDTIPNAINCDSIITINLTVNDVIYDTLNPNACSSYLSPSGMHVWDSTGTYQDTIVVGGGGCDTVFTVNLSINESFASLTDSACGSYTSPSGQVWTISGTYADTIPNMANCDSIITINLTVTTLDITVTQNGNTLTSNATGVSYQWIYCDSNFAPIPGATSASYSAAADGSYAVVVSQNGCSDTSACILLTPSAIQPTLFTGQITVVPNPHQHEFRLDLPQEYDQVGIAIADVTGKLVYQHSYANAQFIPLRVQGAPGFYFVQVKADGMAATLKVMKQNMR